MGGMYRKRYFKNSTFEALSVIEPVVKKHGLTMLETALRWCVHHSALNICGNKEKTAKGWVGQDGIIVGVSSLEQLQGNLRDLEKGPLPEEVVQALDEAWMVAKAGTTNYVSQREI